MRDVVVLGAGLHRFGRFPDKSLQDLGREAIKNALDDSGVPFPDIEVAYVGRVLAGMGAGLSVVSEMGQTGIPVINIEMACGSSTSAFREAYLNVANGVYDSGETPDDGGGLGDWLDVDFVRAVVVFRDRLSADEMQTLKTPTTTAQLDMAPVYIFIFADLSALEDAANGENFRALLRLGVLNRSHGWSDEFVERTAGAYLRDIMEDEDRAPLRIPAPGSDAEPQMVSREALRLARTAIGIAQEYALLAAVDEGLGAQLSGVNVNAARGMLGFPDSWISSSPMLLGYHGESVEAGGQRPREPFEEDFFELRHGHPFFREPAVVDRLKSVGMIQSPAPFSWRMAEVQGLARKFGLPD